MANYELENLDISQQLYKNSTSPIVFLDKSLSVIWANDKALELFPSMRQADGLMLYISLEQKESLIESLDNGKATISKSANFPFSDLTLMFTPIISSSGGYFTICQLISEPLVQSENDKKNLISILSYQIREPLFYIFSSSTYLKHLISKNGLTDGESFLNSVTDNSYKILRAATMMSMYSRYVDGTSTLCPKTIDICNFFYNLCDAVSILTKASGIPFTYNIPQKCIYAEISEDKLSTAILNIIYNSFIYTCETNHITVSLTENQSFVTITIKDRGIGMTKEQLAGVFSPMSSFSENISSMSNMGLGLTLSKMIINEHGGTMAISSDQKSGTTIAFNLPISKKDVETLTLNQHTTDYISDHFSSLYVNLIGFGG